MKKILLIILILTLLGCTKKEKDQEINISDYYNNFEHENIDSKEIIYLWDKNNIPSKTKYTINDNGYFDDPDFIPYITVYNVKENTKIKGAVLINPGGAFIFRSESNEGIEVAEKLSSLGYVSFVVHYRLRPYTQSEGALDLARAIRYVRMHASDYNIDEENIAIIGFSAGGILCGEEILNFSGLINGTKLDTTYIPDELDKISANISAVGMIYSFYGRLSYASTDVELFKNSNLPPAFYAYGTEDPFYNQMNNSVKALKEAGVSVESHVLKNRPHGFGIGKNDDEWINPFDKWLTKIFETNGEKL